MNPRITFLSALATTGILISLAGCASTSTAGDSPATRPNDSPPTAARPMPPRGGPGFGRGGPGGPMNTEMQIAQLTNEVRLLQIQIDQLQNMMQMNGMARGPRFGRGGPEMNRPFNGPNDQDPNPPQIGAPGGDQPNSGAGPGGPFGGRRGGLAFGRGGPGPRGGFGGSGGPRPFGRGPGSRPSTMPTPDSAPRMQP